MMGMLWMVPAVGQANDTFTADRHKERSLACDSCHKEPQPKTPASGEACLACHKSIEAVSERTKHFVTNPHDNHITASSDVECTQCHHGHKADVPLCNQCHAGFKFEKKEAESKNN
jgi:hypothetical protein